MEGLPFGPNWLPLSSWMENFLFKLLHWPGCKNSKDLIKLSEIRQEISDRINYIYSEKGIKSNILFLTQSAKLPDNPPEGSWTIPLRIGLIQTIIPTFDDYRNNISDLEFRNATQIRNNQRRHLAAVIAGIDQMLRIRETHHSQTRFDKRLVDLLIFPELAIHSNDIDPIIIPFMRAHKCMIYMGLVYHRLYDPSNSQLINSSLWLIPEWDPKYGLQIRHLEQGKRFLAPIEIQVFGSRIISFCPAQWIIEYQWNSNPDIRPLRLTGSICYDATDILFAADLRDKTDIFIVSSLNRDVGMFDRMSDALHYHLYQGMIIVNNGSYGGSHFFLPYQEAYQREVLHVHGQPQVSISFVEINAEKIINRPISNIHLEPPGEWKTPPAGWEPF